jgi:hypothetical protein
VFGAGLTSKKTTPEALASGVAGYMLAYERTEYLCCGPISRLCQVNFKNRAGSG